MKFLLYLMATILVFSAAGTFALNPNNHILPWSSGIVGVYFYFQARNWTIEKSKKIFGERIKQGKST